MSNTTAAVTGITIIVECICGARFESIIASDGHDCEAGHEADAMLLVMEDEHMGQTVPILTAQDIAIMDKVVDLELIAQQSKNCLGFSTNIEQSRRGMKADIQRAWDARMALTAEQEAAYPAYRRAQLAE